MIKRELTIFLFVGTLTLLIDFLTYRGLIWAQLFGVDMAKGIAFLIGTIFAYFANRFWTFGHKAHAVGSVWRFILVYSLTLAVNVLVNSFLLTWLPNNVLFLLNELVATNKVVLAYTPLNDGMKIILSKILNKEEAVIQIAYLVATVTSAALNFIGMKLFVFKITPIWE